MSKYYRAFRRLIPASINIGADQLQLPTAIFGAPIEGASDFAVIRSFIATAKKQGWKIVDALKAQPESLEKSFRLS
jgi:hypothetical protein